MGCATSSGWPSCAVWPSTRHNVLNAHPQIATVLKPVMDKLTNTVMIRLNSEADVTGKDWSLIARERLTKNGFVTTKS
ncbi:MAG: glycine betaine ABC transporter substrate-binding protein [Sciscionella sp.]